MERGACVQDEGHVLWVRPRECAPTVRHLTGEKKSVDDLVSFSGGTSYARATHDESVKVSWSIHP